MIAQWDISKDPSNANLKELYTKWKSLLAQDTTQIPESEKLANSIYTTIYRLIAAATITFTKRKGAATKRGQLARRPILHSYNFLMNTDGFTLTFIATVKMKSEALEVNL